MYADVLCEIPTFAVAWLCCIYIAGHRVDDNDAFQDVVRAATETDGVVSSSAVLSVQLLVVVTRSAHAQVSEEVSVDARKLFSF